YIVFPGEAESLVESLLYFDLSEFGCPSWYKQHYYIERLNLQAVASARSASNEFVKELLVSHNKVLVLLSNLVSCSLWLERILPIILDSEYEPTSSFPIYIILHHHAILSNILETVLYHSEAMETLGDSSVDLVDWCYYQMCFLIKEANTNDSKQIIAELKEKVDHASIKDELKAHQSVIRFEIGMKAIALMRYLIEHSCSDFAAEHSNSTCLPLGVIRRILNTYDIPILFCNLIELAPWSVMRVVKGSDGSLHNKKFYWHESGCWIEADEMPAMTKLEGQLWLGLYQVLFNHPNTINYDLTLNHRKNNLLSLRSQLTEQRLDNLPVLINLRRFLEELALSDASYAGSNRNPGLANFCLVEALPIIHDDIIRSHIIVHENL
ncbi:unnamed protein product, partial [Protopolystoma xenopodis]